MCVDIPLWFWFIFPWWLVILCTFHVPVGHLYVFFGKMSLQILCHFNQVLFVCYWVLWNLYISWILTCYQMISKYFLQFVKLPLLLDDGFLCSAEGFELMWFYLFILTFVAIAFGIKSKKSLSRPMSRSLLPIFSSRSFMVSGLTFKFLMHFELTFVYGVR